MKKIFVLAMFLVLITSGCTLIKKDEVSEISLEDAKIKATEFINGYLMNPGQEVSIKEVVEENGLYKVVVNMQDGQEIDSYLSKDGATFFPSAIVIAEFMSNADGEKTGEDTAQATPEETLDSIEKREKPAVELFVMSHCPYGTQIEKGILPVLDALGDKIDFDLKFVDYAMHGQPEIDEQLSQYCVQKNSPEKLNEYLYCFLEEGDGEGCLTKIGVNQSSHQACVTATDNEFGVTDSFNDKTTYKGTYPPFAVFASENQQYGVTGSPSLVVNGKKIGSGRDSAGLLETICAGFENAPSECDNELSAASPSPGFGFGTASAATEAECN